MTNNETLRNILSCLNRHAFSRYVFSLFRLEDGIKDTKSSDSPPYLLKTADLSETCGKYVFEQHHHKPHEFQAFTGIFIYTEPIDLFYGLSDIDIATPGILKSIEAYKHIMDERTASWFYPQDGEFGVPHIVFATNYSNINKNDYEKLLFPKFARLISNWEYEPALLVGSIDSFIELNEVNSERAFDNFISNYKDGVSISLSDDKFAINDFLVDNYLSDGVLRNSRNPCESVFVRPVEKSQILLEFEYLVNSNPKESELESFLKRYYREIFGFEYDRIETQLWLRFPDLDISQKNRRLDIFLKNSIQNDWELFEIKKMVQLTRTYRDIPVLSNEVQNAVQQLRNYSNILSQDVVKRKMAEEGIEYYVPELRLVIGRSPSISHAQWRWLKSTNEKDVKIITYDELLESMKKRKEYHQYYSLETKST